MGLFMTAFREHLSHEQHLAVGGVQWPRPEPGAAHNEGRAVLVGDSGVWLAALMCELGRSAT
jgi:hypothetical protein